MLGLDGYGSGSESENDQEQQQVTKPTSVTTSSASTSSFSSLKLPPPSASASSSKISLPPPKTNKRAPKKIAIGLPTLSKGEYEEQDDIEAERPATKRQRIDGAGRSGLLYMLPAPKQKGPISTQPQRVLGGGGGPGLVFNTSRSTAPVVQSTPQDLAEEVDEQQTSQATSSISVSSPSAMQPKTSSLPFLPPSLAKGRVNISLEDERPNAAKSTTPKPDTPAVDFFSLGNSNEASSSNSTTPSTAFSLPTLSSAPAVPTFEPPEPTQQDPYPGYYQLPSGTWAAYDSAYYEKFRKRWQIEYDAYVRKLEKGAIKGFEGYEGDASEVNALKEMEKAKVEIKDREEKKALTQGGTGAPEQPRMKINASKLSGIARSRHQLSTLLKEAYENREALEERIAQGRRNRKEAGNKYGF